MRKCNLYENSTFSVSYVDMWAVSSTTTALYESAVLSYPHT